ncbi:uncharacterized protein LOC134847939 isoform X2 [Symsagittifera roscoffensis]|uniref:uncharacterized protein LOC134847939 isoform X2 n=1 Tax=Symsagittifera roscoffensis TaxID=84072 RepID=UPI00307B7E92
MKMGSSKDRNSLRSKLSVNTKTASEKHDPNLSHSFVSDRKTPIKAEDAVSIRSGRSARSVHSRAGRRRRHRTKTETTRPPTLVSEILKKRTPFQKFDPTLIADEREIELLVHNEKERGRLPNETDEHFLLDEKRARALRHWEYLRHVTKALGANRRMLIRVQKKRLEEQRRELEFEEEKLKNNLSSLYNNGSPNSTQPEDGLRQGSSEVIEGHESKEEISSGVMEKPTGDLAENDDAESVDYNVYFDEVNWSHSENRTRSFEHRQNKNNSRQQQLNELRQTNSLSNLKKDSEFCLTEIPSGNGSQLIRSRKFAGKETWELDKIPDATVVDKNSFDQAEEDDDDENEETLIECYEDTEYNLQSAPLEDNQTSTLKHPSKTASASVTSGSVASVPKRSIFAAPRWNPKDPESLSRIHAELMRMPLVYTGVERGVDIPSDFEQSKVPNANENHYETIDEGALRGIDSDGKIRKKFAFHAPPTVKLTIPHKGKVSSEDNKNEDENEEEHESFFEIKEVPFDAEGHAYAEKELLLRSTESDVIVDLAEEYERRKNFIKWKKEQLHKLEQKAIRFQSSDQVALTMFQHKREFLNGYSVLPENYTGKVVLNVIYGNNSVVPAEARIENAKHQLYVSVTHLFDFSRFELLNKKKPRIAFLLRPLDKTFPYPKGANKYREVQLNRKSGEVTGEGGYCTFEVCDHTIKKRWLFIRVKAYKGLVPSDFLGQVKIEFDQFERAQDIQIVDKEAYLYGKFRKVGTLDVEMYYKLQQGCLTVTVHSANIIPSSENPGDTSVKLYHRYMGRLVEKMRSSVQRETFMPVYEETFTLKLPKGMIEESILQFRLMSKPAVTFIRDSILGEVNLAQRTNCDEWKTFFSTALMSENPKPIRATLPLMYYM